MKRGFTLIELMAVIIILSLLVILAAPPILEKLKKTENDVDAASLALIESAVDLYIDDNADIYKNVNGSVYCLSLQQLVDSGKLDAPILNTKTGDDLALDTLVEVKLVNKTKIVAINNNCIEYNEPSSPELVAGMIPVKWNGTNWIKADINNVVSDNQWYDYNAKMWANAVTVTSTNRTTLLNAAVGTTIPFSDINTMWVWVPRYKYAIPSGTGARSINIVFESKATAKSTGDAINKNYRTHPAFTFGSTEVGGIWVGKFETTGAIESPTILPNTASLRSQTIKAMYDASRSMQNNSTYGTSTDGNIHMAKDSEWGAVAYLSHSQYGINNEIWINNSSTYTTGCAGISASASSYSGCQNQYNTVTGVNASTTGNIYGVYDMSGGAWEYVMGMYRPTDATSVTDNSGFGATTSNGTLPTSEYWDRYTSITDITACSGGICYGSSLSETNGWYVDGGAFVSSTAPWSLRGGQYCDLALTGAFDYGRNSGGVGNFSSFRLVQLKP